MANNLSGRNVIITGAAGGVGRVVTRAWLAAGARVLAADRSDEALAGLALAARGVAGGGGGGAAIFPFAGDATTVEGAEAIVAEARRVFSGPPDTLVHLVGGFAMGALDSPDAPAQWNTQFALNIQSAFSCYRAMLPALKERGGGWIVGMGSRAALAPPAKMAAYAASKAALIALTQSLAEEVQGADIHVNIILASTIDTPANRAAMGASAAGTWVRAEDIADATLYLCSDRAASVYGATLEVYGKA